jgi:hypothetical protein
VQVQRLGDGGRDEARIGKRREIDEGHAVWVGARFKPACHDPLGDGECQARFAAAAGACEGEHPCPAGEQQGSGRQLALAADQAGGR